MPEPPRKRWSLPQAGCPPEWAALGPELGIPGPGLAVLWNRGLRSRGEIPRFLDPAIEHLEDPYLLTDMRPAVERLRRALDARETALCFGDYDVDGITAAALWARVLRGLGGRIGTLIPNRMEDGFGLSARAVERARECGAGLLIVSDCGTTAHAAVARARELGIDVLIADHHIPDAELPPVTALVNPWRRDDRYPFRHLAAVGVSFKVLQALCREVGAEAERLLHDQLDLVALGTVADVSPLQGENRVLVCLGLRQMRERPRPAMSALIEAAGIEDRNLESSDLAFFLAPRLNASGRLGAPERALALLLEDDPGEARRLARRLEEDNRERRKLNEKVQDDAARVLRGDGGWSGRGPIVLGSPDWHPGVLGIAASRLADRYGVPVVLVSLAGEIARGSARTPPGGDLLALLATAQLHLRSFGGHRQAAGLSLRPEDFPAFQDALALAAAASGAGADLAEPIPLDGELDPAACDLTLVRFLDRLGPFGSGNEEPLFFGRALCRGPRVVQGRHLRLRAGPAGGTDCVGFGLGPRAGEIPHGGVLLELIYRPSLNRYHGEDRVQLKIREFRLGGRGAGPGSESREDPLAR